MGDAARIQWVTCLHCTGGGEETGLKHRHTKEHGLLNRGA